MNVKKIGIIGCGAVTQQFYAKILPKIKNIKVEYVYDLNVNASNKAAEIFEATSISLEGLIDNSDAIIIATPPASHFELLQKTLLNEKMVICEKPFLTKLENANCIYEQVERNNVKLYVAHFRRMYPSVNLAKNLLNTGIFGKIKEIRMYEGGRFNWGANSNYFFENKLGGVLFDTGSHLIDMAIYIAGLDLKLIKTEVISVARNKVEPSHEIKSALLVFDNNQKINIKLHLSRFQLLANQIQIITENGTLFIPSFLSNYIKILNQDKSSVVYASENYSGNLEAFYYQYINIFNQYNDDIFDGYRFKNLTEILELIFTFNKRNI